MDSSYQLASATRKYSSPISTSSPTRASTTAGEENKIAWPRLIDDNIPLIPLEDQNKNQPLQLPGEKEGGDFHHSNVDLPSWCYFPELSWKKLHVVVIISRLRIIKKQKNKLYKTS